MYKRGDIVLIPFPFSDLSGQKIRPALVVSAQKGGDDVVVLFITSKVKTVRSTNVPIEPSSCNGIKVASIIVCDKLATLDRHIVLGAIGELEKELLKNVDVALCSVLGL